MEDPYDVIIIGGGPGGYVGAIRAAQLGLKTAIVEVRGKLGGTCLNVGCIPSKAMLQSSHHFEMAGTQFAHHGIKVSGLTLDLKTMLNRKDKVIHDLTKGIEFLIKKNKIDYYIGAGRITDSGEVTVVPSKKEDKKQVLKTANIIIATGSAVTPLPGVDIDEKRIVSSTGALDIPKVPRTMAIIGAGVIGLELGSVWRRLGADVTVIEFLDVALPEMDGDVSTHIQRILSKQGLKFKMNTRVTSAKAKKNGVMLTMQSRDGNEAETIETDIVLVAIGRSPYTQGLGLDDIGVATDERGFILVDEDFQTNIAGIYAIGDVIGGAMLAHKAEDEGVICAEIMSGMSGHINYNLIPGIVYTHPEVAVTGMTEEQLKKAGVDYNVGTFPFSANSRARCNGDSDGFVKILSDRTTDLILGCHVIGPSGGDLIQEVVNVMEFGGSAEDIARICHGHPGLPEAIKEAALDAGGRAIHI
ncbi:MAG: dihydrolipoyl dehydrogenase [Rhodospirillaceae bacterium TMED8]|nr:dihydrolipoyl dehydrogenase [Magnetovibrio sp.]OUT48594.1 MAG: dihydrolipoyl dehydrogenase [Rhodospirillaceae bacterium TMED8]|tara:strand:+ start:672 stop:2084 length:1413 start_codon:yes stop_codon:yes gene_type:complete